MIIHVVIVCVVFKISKYNVLMVGLHSVEMYALGSNIKGKNYRRGPGKITQRVRVGDNYCQ